MDSKLGSYYGRTIWHGSVHGNEISMSPCIRNGDDPRWPLPVIIVQLFDTDRHAHIWCSVSKTSTDMRCTRIEEVSQTVEDRIAQGVLSYTCMISNPQLYISTTLMQSNAPIGNLNRKTCSISKIARGPYSLHSNIHGSTCYWHATSTHRNPHSRSFCNLLTS